MQFYPRVLIMKMHVIFDKKKHILNMLNYTNDSTSNVYNGEL